MRPGAGFCLPEPVLSSLEEPPISGLGKETMGTAVGDLARSACLVRGACYVTEQRPGRGKASVDGERHSWCREQHV